MIKYLFFIALFNTLVYSQWEVQSLSGGSNSIYFTDLKTGYSVGYSGTIYKTTDGGLNWNSQTSNTTSSLHSIFFVDSQSGWIAGDAGLILKTTNAGENWTLIQSGIRNHLNSVFFINKKVGWTVCYGAILKTTDGGFNWTIYSTGQPSLYSCFFIDENNGWAVGDQGAILRTINGGNSWIGQNIANNGFYSVYFIDQFTGYAAGTDGGKEIIYKTINGGETWTLNYQYSFNLRLNSICFQNINNGWAVGNNSRIINTTDGGNTWVPFNSLLSSHNESIFFLDKNNGWITGLGGIQKTYLQLISPANGAENQKPDSTVLTWNSALGAQRYLLQVSTDSLFAVLVVNDSSITTTSKTISGLTKATKYYWRVIAKSANNYDFTSKYRIFSTEKYFVNGSCNPNIGGTIKGVGLYYLGQIAILNAVPNYSYKFLYWTENGNIISTDSIYSFTVTQNRNIVANFISGFVIAIINNPTIGGTTSGWGIYFENQTATVKAQNSAEFKFINWTENGYVVSTNIEYSFSVVSNRNLLANFSRPCSGIPTLDYQGKIYNTVKIGNQCWLRENIDVGKMINNSTEQSNNNIIEKYCYNNDTNNCIKYGGLYQWAEAVQYRNGATNSTFPNPRFSENVQGICPIGWHIPSQIEYENLKTFVNNSRDALLSVGNLTGNNSSCFSALITGYSIYQGGNYTYFWNATDNYSNTAYRTALHSSNSQVDNNYDAKTNFFSVRCILDSCKITINYSPDNSGVVTGFGNYEYGQTVQLKAIANSEYSFVNWTENNMIVSTDSIYSFIATTSRTLTANFIHLGYLISGTLQYDNVNSTPLSSIQIICSANNINIDTVLTDSGGNFSFIKKQNGIYKLSPRIITGWNGVNSADALAVSRYYVGIDNLTGLKLKAADVNNSGNINTTDSYDILRRFVGITNSFSAGDWFTETPTISVNGSSVIQNIKAICIGDVNGSYSVTLTKPSSKIKLLKEGNQFISDNNTFTVPFRIDGNITAGAMSLILQYNSDSYIVNSVKSAIANFQYSVKADKIKIGLFKPEGINLKHGDIIFELNVSSKNSSLKDLQIQIESESEINDKTGNIINNISFITPTTELSKVNNYSLEQNYPNPFNPSTTIKYALPIDSQVEIKISNPIGQVVRTLVSGVKLSGVHEIKFDAANMPSGIYFYSIDAKSLDGSKTFRGVNKLILMK